MSPVGDPLTELSLRSDGNVHALALLAAARQVGLLEALLAEAGTVEEAADRVGVDREAAQLVATVCERKGLVTRVGGELEPTNRALGLLTTRDVRSIGRLPDALDVLDGLAALPGRLNGEPIGDGSSNDTSPRDGSTPDASLDHADRRRHRLGADWATPRRVVVATATAALGARPLAATVLDLGGGAGVHAAELARRGRTVTLHETPPVAETVEPILASRDVEVSAGPLEAPPAGPFDLVVGPQLPHRIGAEALRGCSRPPGMPVGPRGSSS